jgi:hypothetical protein
LNADEKETLLRVANEWRFADMPPARIVPALADKGVYLASESSFHRVLRAHGQHHHRGRAKAPRPNKSLTTGHRSVLDNTTSVKARTLSTSVGCFFSSL